jgi:hypothetical protein
MSLRALLAENRTRDPEYRGGLSNHQSMALGALRALGANDAQLARFAQTYGARLVPRRARAPLVSNDFRASIGTPAALVGVAELFERELEGRERASLLAEVLPELVPGISGAAFHGLIRTAYALDAEDDAELAHALAYFVTVAKPLRALPAPLPGAADAPAALVACAAADEALAKGTFRGLISDALRLAANQAGFDAHVAVLRVGPATLDELAAVALEHYVRTLDFTALHAVTSTHALRLLLPYLEDPEPALRYQFQALLAARLTSPGRSDHAELREPLADFPALARIALESDDDHAAKFVFSCWEEAKVRPTAAYREAAALKLRLF